MVLSSRVQCMLPEITEEALQVVGVTQLGLALVRTLPQAVPRLV